MDMVELDKISSAWGLPDVSLFATATLARPWKKMSRPYLEKASMSDAFAMHTKAKGRLVEFLKNSDKIPKELIFIGRNLNCIRGINKELGSVVNRINIMAKWAAWAAKDDESGANTDGLISSLILAVKRQLNLVIFQSLLFVGTLGFYYARTIQRVKGWFGLSDPGFEGFMDARMKAEIEQKMPGIVIDESIFNS